MKNVKEYLCQILIVSGDLFRKESTFILQLLLIFMVSASFMPTIRLAVNMLENNAPTTTRTFWFKQAQAKPTPVPSPTETPPPVKVATEPIKKAAVVTHKSPSFKVQSPPKVSPASPTRTQVVPPKKTTLVQNAPEGTRRPTTSQSQKTDALQEVKTTLKQDYNVNHLPSYEASMQWARKTLKAYRKNT